MKQFAHNLLWSVVALATLLAACGGSNDEATTVQVTEVTSSTRTAVAGHWPRFGTGSAVIVRSEQEWRALWQQRLATLDCQVSSNASACATTEPPQVDFALYDLVGVFAETTYYFVPPTPTRATLNNRRNVLTIEYQYSPVLRAPFLLFNAGEFFLVPKTGAQLEAQPSEA